MDPGGVGISSHRFQAGFTVAGYSGTMAASLPCKLLLAEDEPGIREILQFCLKSFASEIIIAENGRVAAGILEKEPISAVVSDIAMPQMTGLELLAWARKANLQTPFVMLTGHGEKSNVIEAFRLGAVDFIEKPFDLKVIRASVQKAIALGTSLRELEACLRFSQKAGQGVPVEVVERVLQNKRAFWPVG